jgi:hypothetical protein
MPAHCPFVFSGRSTQDRCLPIPRGDPWDDSSIPSITAVSFFCRPGGWTLMLLTRRSWTNKKECLPSSACHESAGSSRFLLRSLGRSTPVLAILEPGLSSTRTWLPHCFRKLLSWPWVVDVPTRARRRPCSCRNRDNRVSLKLPVRSLNRRGTQSSRF